MTPGTSNTAAAPAAVTLPAEAPACPQNWYLVAYSREILPGRTIVREIGELELVLFRSEETGGVAAFAAHCSHAGCHLKHAAVTGRGLRCALHHRVIATDGAFLLADGSGAMLHANRYSR